MIRAFKQLNGRGRYEKIWVSDNDLTFSILFKGDNYNHHLLAPIAIINALEEFNIKRGLMIYI